MLLRQYVSSSSVNTSKILSYARQIGQHDGAISYYVAVALNTIQSTLSAAQKANFSAIAAGTPACSRSWYLSYPVKMPSVNPCYVTYLLDGTSTCKSFYDTVTIPTGSLAVTYVNATAYVGKSVYVKWSKTGSVGSYLKIYLYQGQTLIQNMSTSTLSSAGAFKGTILAKAANYLNVAPYFRLKLVDGTTPSIFTYSPQFQIKGTISPVTTSIAPGSTVSVITLLSAFQTTWTFSGTLTTAVKAELYKGGAVVQTLSLNTKAAYYGPNQGQLLATPASSLCSGPGYTVKVTDKNDSLNYAFSSPFAIRAKITVSTTTSSPTLGKMFNVSWSWIGLCGNSSTKVSLDLYTNGPSGTYAGSLTTASIRAITGRWGGILDSTKVPSGGFTLRVRNKGDAYEYGALAVNILNHDVTGTGSRGKSMRGASYVMVTVVTLVGFFFSM